MWKWFIFRSFWIFMFWKFLNRSVKSWLSRIWDYRLYPESQTQPQKLRITNNLIRSLMLVFTSSRPAGATTGRKDQQAARSMRNQRTISVTNKGDRSCRNRGNVQEKWVYHLLFTIPLQKSSIKRKQVEIMYWWISDTHVIWVSTTTFVFLSWDFSTHSWKFEYKFEVNNSYTHQF